MGGERKFAAPRSKIWYASVQYLELYKFLAGRFLWRRINNDDIGSS